jgi:hypothetical protein
MTGICAEEETARVSTVLRVNLNLQAVGVLKLKVQYQRYNSHVLLREAEHQTDILYLSAHRLTKWTRPPACLHVKECSNVSVCMVRLFDMQSNRGAVYFLPRKA